MSDYNKVNLPTAKLNNGREIPVLGLGTWKAAKNELAEVVKSGVRVGFRHIDNAAMYLNDEGMGDGLEAVYKDGKVKREDLWITSKLSNHDHSAENVRKGCQTILNHLKTDYLDLFLMHWPVAMNEGPTVDPPIKETWQATEKLVDDGLVRTIGVSNFSVKKLEELLSYARIVPAVHQIEVHPYFRNSYNVDFCRSKGIHVTAYSPLGSPDSASMSGRGEDVPELLKDPEVKKIADKLNKHPAQVLIRWAIQNGTSVIPKASSESHMRSNLDVLDWQLSDEDFHTLSSLKFQARMVDGSMFLKTETGPYKTLDQLWDGELTGENPSVPPKSMKASADA